MDKSQLERIFIKIEEFVKIISGGIKVLAIKIGHFSKTLIFRLYSLRFYVGTGSPFVYFNLNFINLYQPNPFVLYFIIDSL